MSKTQTINWLPFSLKQKRYFQKALTCKMSVLEGAIRTGKTILNCLVAATYLEKCKDKIHLASGSSIPNAKLNIGDCNGFGLEYLFRGRCRWGKYKDNEALFIQTQTGEKIVVFAGGGKADSYKKILGNSYGLWIATEINEHYDSDDSKTSFIKVAFGRQTAAIEPKVLWDLNPSKPDAPIYTQYIDNYKIHYVGGYNYCHLTMNDVMHITPQRRKEIESQYVVGSVWYRRDILGERCVAEGLCFEYIANNIESFMCDFDFFKDRIALISLGIDFGGNKSATTFVATAILYGYKDIVHLAAKRIKKSLTPEELNDEFNAFCWRLYGIYGKPMVGWYDSAESVLGNGLKISSLKSFGRCQLNPAFKYPINERISCYNILGATHHLWFYRDGEGIEEVTTAVARCVFDDKEQRVDIVSYDNPIDIQDANEYSWERWILQLTKLHA